MSPVFLPAAEGVESVDSTDFSIVLGGSLYQLYRRSRLLEEPAEDGIELKNASP